MKALGFGVLTGILLATIAASLVFALADRPSPTGTRVVPAHMEEFYDG